MKAEDYVIEWCFMTYGIVVNKLEDWNTEEVMKFANDFADKKINESKTCNCNTDKDRA